MWFSSEITERPVMAPPELKQLLDLIAEILTIVHNYPELMDVAVRRFNDIMADIRDGLGMTPRTCQSAGEKQCVAYLEITAMLASSGIPRFDIVPFRHFARTVLQKAGIGDEIPQKRALIYQKLSEHWDAVRTPMLEVVRAWIIRKKTK
jgi:hypothetical protein